MVFKFIVMNKTLYKISVDDVRIAKQNVKELVKHTPLIKMLNYSERDEARIHFKREDLQLFQFLI